MLRYWGAVRRPGGWFVPVGEETEQQLAALLEAHPDATVFAITLDSFDRPPLDHPGLAGLGREPSDVLGPIEALELLHPDSQPTAMTDIDRVEEGGYICDELYLADGSPVDSYFFDTNPTRKLYIGVQVPVHDREPHVSSRQVHDLVPVRVRRLLTDGLGRVISADGLDEIDEVTIGELAIRAVHPEDLNELRHVWASMLATPGVAHRHRLRSKADGETWGWWEMSATSMLDDPDQPAVHVEMVDISAEMAAHDEIRRRERTLHRLAEALPQAIIQLDRDGSVVYANGRANAMISGELVELAPLLAVVDDDVRPQLKAALAESLAGADRDLELTVHHPVHGSEVVVEVLLRALSTDQGTPDGAMCCLTDVTERVRHSERLEQRATFDQLTGVHNRGSALRALDHAVADPHAGGVAVVFIDLDHFKAVNDVHGHAAGDAVLTAVADRINGVVRARDVVGRLGGDEFVVVCPEINDSIAAVAAAERIATALDPTGTPDNPFLGVRASIGVAWAPEVMDPAELLSQADEAMYTSKRGGVGEVVLFAAT